MEDLNALNEVEEETPNEFGRRLREIRVYRGMTQEVLAGLAGFKSQGTVSKLENGLAPVPNRNVLEALAWGLRVAPSEFTGRPWERARPTDSAAHAGLVAVEAALDAFELGEDPGVPVREWPEVQADVERLRDLQHLYADYAAQGELAPRLLAELHAAYVRHPEHRREALEGLITAYSSAVWICKRLGGRGSALLAAKEAQRCAAELEMPQWVGYAAWLRGDAVGALSRSQQLKRAVATADALRPALDDPEVAQAFGMLQLSAALAAAAQNDRDTSNTHLTEARKIAGRLDDEVGQFARLWFGRPNVGIWTVALGVEFGDEPQAVDELARGVNVEAIPSQSRRAEFYADIGRSLLTERRTQDKGLALLLRAEDLAPQRIRNDLLIREAVADQLRSARRDAAGRELRGLAYRLNLAPAG